MTFYPTERRAARLPKDFKHLDTDTYLSGIAKKVWIAVVFLQIGIAIGAAI